MTARMAAAAIALCLVALGNAQADQPRARRLATPPASGSARDGISGNSVARAGAHGIVGGPTVAKPAMIGSVILKQHH